VLQAQKVIMMGTFWEKGTRNFGCCSFCRHLATVPSSNSQPACSLKLRPVPKGLRLPVQHFALL
jgi:hypothetical protein